MYVYYGQTTTKLEVYKNEYKAEAKLKEQTPNMEVTDFEIEIEVKKGDVILFALDCLEDIASDQTHLYRRNRVFVSAMFNSGYQSCTDKTPGEDVGRM